MNPNAITPIEPYDELTQLALSQVAVSSQKVYAPVYRRWRDYARVQGFDALDMRPARVLAYLETLPVAKRSRAFQLNVLRQLARMLFVLSQNETANQQYQALKMISAPTAGVVPSDRQQRALSPAEAYRVLNVWTGDNARALRNRALVALLFLTGVRRAEAAALEWRDIAFDEGAIHIRHGKGDKARIAAVVGDMALDALKAWQRSQGLPNLANLNTHVFTPVLKNGQPGADRPISGTDVYRIVVETSKLSGVEFRPHDARRTLATESLMEGAPLAEVQAQLGHAQASTTLKYAIAGDAAARREKLRLRYG